MYRNKVIERNYSCLKWSYFYFMTTSKLWYLLHFSFFFFVVVDREWEQLQTFLLTKEKKTFFPICSYVLYNRFPFDFPIYYYAGIIEYYVFISQMKKKKTHNYVFPNLFKNIFFPFVGIIGRYLCGIERKVFFLVDDLFDLAKKKGEVNNLVCGCHK